MTPQEQAEPGGDGRGRQRRPARILVVAVNVVLLGVLGVELGLHRFEIVRRLEYWRTGTIELEGIRLALPSDDPFLKYLLDHGTRDTESTLATLLRRELRPGDTFIDIGANIGWFTLIAARQVGAEGRVIAFEPEPRNFALLKRNVELNGLKNVVLVPKAVSNSNGTLRLNLSTTHENHSVAVLGDQRGAIDVETVRLDDYLAGPLRTRPIRCIKIDTEGAEGLILAGMPRTLERWPDLRLFLEFDPFLLRAAGTDPRGLLDRALEDGFTIARINEQADKTVPVSRDALAALATGRGCNLFLHRGDAAPTAAAHRSEPQERGPNGLDSQAGGG